VVVVMSTVFAWATSGLVCQNTKSTVKS
jgi:hypothetical protein